MTDEDYSISFCDKNIVKYAFRADLELVLCDGLTAYEYIPGKPYCSTLSHNKSNNDLIIVREGGMLRIRFVRGKWKACSRKTPDPAKFYTKDSKGDDLLLSSEHYTFETNEKGSCIYIFIQGVRCHKVMVNGLLVWEKKEDEKGYPMVIIINKLGRVSLSFEEQILTFIEKTDCYEQVETKHKRPSKKK